MTMYRRQVPNYVTNITNLSHFDDVFKMAEIADEPDEYLSDENQGPRRGRGWGSFSPPPPTFVQKINK